MNEDAQLLKRFWLLDNFGSTSFDEIEAPMERYMYDDRDQRYFHFGINSEEHPLYAIEVLVGAVIETEKAKHNEQSFGILGRIFRKIFIAGLLALTEGREEYHIREAKFMIALQEEIDRRQQEQEPLPRWYSKLYPAIVRGKEDIIHSLDEDLTEICNHKQCSVDRAIKESLIYGAKKLRKKAVGNSKRKYSSPGRNRPCWIYGLVDPDSGQVCYVGKSVHPMVRWREHLSDKDNSLKVAWLKELDADGIQPDLRILEETTVEMGSEAEKRWVAYGLVQGWPLTNQRLTATP